MVNIFISYSHRNKSLATKILQGLSAFGVKIIIDERAVKYTDNLRSYMKTIRTSDYSILLISDDYLKSYYCMFEITELIKELDFNDKILPVIIEDYYDGDEFRKGAEIYDRLKSIDYLKYWEKEYDLLENKIMTISIENTGDLIEELRITKNITFNISNFVTLLRNKLNVSFNNFVEDNYSLLLEKIGFQSNISGIRRARVLYGEALFESNFEKKLEIFNKAIELNPLYEEAYTHRGVTKDELGQYNEAIKDYTMALELNPESWTNYTNRGHSFETLGFDEEAMKDFNKAIELNPEDGLAFNNRANLYRKLDHLELALKDVFKAIELEPENDRPYSTLSEIYLCQGDDSNFYKYMSKAVSLGFPLYKYLDDGLYEKYDQEKQFKQLVEQSKESQALR